MFWYLKVVDGDFEIKMSKENLGQSTVALPLHAT